MAGFSRFLLASSFLAAAGCVALGPDVGGPVPATLDRVDLAQCGEGPMIVPDDYVYQVIVEPPLAGIGRLVRSESGRMYFQHAGHGGGTAISELFVDEDRVATVVEFPPWASPGPLIGGPGDDFFVEVGGVIREVQPDGTTTAWGQVAGPLPWLYTPDHRMLAIGDAGTSVVQVWPDGSTDTLLDGLTGIYDLAATTDGTIYVSDFPAGELVELAPDGTHRVLAPIAEDNTDLVVDQADALYLANAASGFVRVDRTTGAKTPMTLANAPCPVVQSPADIEFDGTRAVFASWVASKLTWADFASGTGGELLHGAWANSPATALGPDDAFYVGVTGCGTAIPSVVSRHTLSGTSEVYAGGLSGNVNSIDFGPDGSLYVATSSETGVGVYRHDPATGDVSLVPGTSTVDVHSVAYDDLGDRLLAGTASQGTDEATLRAYTGDGLVGEYTVTLTEALASLQLDLGPDGTVWGFGPEQEHFFVGPVDHYTMQLDLEAGTSVDLFVHRREGCCTASSFSVDDRGHAWVVLNPDFLLYEVDPVTGASLFACNTPLDALGVQRTPAGDLFLNSPHGLYRVWQPTPAERVGLVEDEVDLLVYYDVLAPGRAGALSASLAAAAASLEREQPVAAERQLAAFSLGVEALVRAGLLPEERAASLLDGVAEVLERL